MLSRPMHEVDPVLRGDTDTVKPQRTFAKPPRDASTARLCFVDWSCVSVLEIADARTTVRSLVGECGDHLFAREEGAVNGAALGDLEEALTLGVIQVALQSDVFGKCGESPFVLGA